MKTKATKNPLITIEQSNDQLIVNFNKFDQKDTLDPKIALEQRVTLDHAIALNKQIISEKQKELERTRKAIISRRKTLDPQLFKNVLLNEEKLIEELQIANLNFKTPNCNYFSIVSFANFRQKITSSDMKKILGLFKKYPVFIKELNLMGHSFEPKAFKMLLKYLEKSPVEKLSLVSCSFNISHCKSLSKFLQNAKIKHLNLNGMDITYDEDWSSKKMRDENLSKMIRALDFSTLEFLSLKYAYARSQTLKELANKSKENSSLKTIELSQNYLNDKIIDEVLDYIHLNPKLESLDLGENYFCNQFIEKLGNKLPGFKNLKILKINGNMVDLSNHDSDGNLTISPTSPLLQNLPLSLTTLDLSGFHFTEGALSVFLSKISESQISTLYLNRCALTKKDLVYLVDYLEQGKVEMLGIMGNHFGADSSQIITNAIRSGLVHKDLKITISEKFNVFDMFFPAKAREKVDDRMIQEALQQNKNSLDEKTMSALRQVLGMIKANTKKDFKYYENQLNNLLSPNTTEKERAIFSEYILNRLELFIKNARNTDVPQEVKSLFSWKISDVKSQSKIEEKEEHSIHSRGGFFSYQKDLKTASQLKKLATQPKDDLWADIATP